MDREPYALSAVCSTPMYNLKATVERTGVAAHTLRAWERRYGLPMPARAESGHRLYSDEDLLVIKWLVSQLDHGLAISRAVDLYHQMVAQGQAPWSGPDDSAQQLPGGDSTLDALRRGWTSAIKTYDERKAERIVSDAFGQFGPEAVAIHILQRGLSEIGDSWYSGEMTVQHEHFASELATRRVEALLGSTPRPHLHGQILIAGPAGERHDFPLLLITLLLRRRGRDVLYLGADVPLDRLEEVLSLRPIALVVSAAQHLRSAAALSDMASFLDVNNTRLAYGGGIFSSLPELRERIRGQFLGETISGGIDNVEYALLSEMAPPVASNGDYADALSHIRERGPALEADLLRALAEWPVDAQHTLIAVSELQGSIRASLSLGDTAFLEPSLNWIEGLLTNRGIPQQVFQQYLEAYLTSARKHLDARGDLLIDWLSRRVHQGKGDNSNTVSSVKAKEIGK